MCFSVFLVFRILDRRPEDKFPTDLLHASVKMYTLVTEFGVILSNVFSHSQHCLLFCERFGTSSQHYNLKMSTVITFNLLHDGCSINTRSFITENRCPSLKQLYSTKHPLGKLVHIFYVATEPDL